MSKVLIRVVLIGMAIAMLEGASWLLLRSSPDLGDRARLVSEGQDPSVRTRAARRIGQQFRGGEFLEEVVHPYLGFVTAPSALAADGPLTLETLGFPGGGPLVRERRPGSVVMAIFGGSVAAYFGHGGGPQRIFEGLQTLPAFAGKELIVLNVASIGYKQPQALLSLAYLQALGVQMDLVILLDGFNEVVVAPFALIPAGVFPFFPGAWSQRVANLDAATEMRSLIGEIAYRSEERARWKTRFASSPLRNSETATLLWALLDRSLEATIEARRLALSAGRSGQQLDYAASGPRWPMLGGPALFDDLAAFWMQCSLGMRALAEAKGALFFHFLQPNQHVPGTKPMGEEEIAVAIRGGEAFAPYVEQGYRFLSKRGEELAASGVHFHDLTRVFADTREPVYVDNIGHVGPRGNEIIADAIAAELRTQLSPAAP